MRQDGEYSPFARPAEGFHLVSDSDMEYLRGIPNQSDDALVDLEKEFNKLNEKMTPEVQAELEAKMRDRINKDVYRPRGVRK